MNRIQSLCSNFPLYSQDPGIDLTKPSGRFKWFLASILFGVPVSIRAAEMAERMNIDLGEFEGEELTRIEDALVKLYLRYGKKGNGDHESHVQGGYD